MSDVKEVKVSLMPQDEKKLTRTTSRKRRKGGASEVVEPVGAEVATVASDPSVYVRTELAPVTDPKDALDTRGQGWLPTANVTKTAPNVVKQVTPALGPTAANVATNVGPPMTGGAVNTVRLTAKKRNSFTGVSGCTPEAPAGAPRILPTKRKGGGSPAMVTTRKKEKLVISSTPPNNPKNTTGGAHASTTRTRKFRERRISITVKPGARTAAKRIREKIAVMPISSIRRMLMRKGVLKPSGKPLPEAMMRSMLQDYMMLHHSD